MKWDGDQISAPVSILSIGAITALGRDLDVIAQQLAAPAASVAVHRVDDELLSDAAVGRRMRRADRFSRMAVLAAQDAWSASESACRDVPKERVGLIVATGFGPHCRGFRFLDGLLDCGDLDALPTDFSHSVHGAAAAYITELLELRGPVVNATDFVSGFEQAVVLARCWLDQDVCDRVMVGVAEEIGEVLVHCASRTLGDHQPLARGDERVAPGEGAVFFVLAPRDVVGIAQLQVTSTPLDFDLLILDEPTISAAGAARPAISARKTTSFSAHFGHTPASSAFQLLGGLLSLRAGQPLGRLIQPTTNGATVSGQVDSAATFKPSCDPWMNSLAVRKI